jgi:hypothetical protein
MPFVPWQPAQLKPPCAVGANSSEPHFTNFASKPSIAPACRLGSFSQYTGIATAVTASRPRASSSTRLSFAPSSSSSSMYGLRFGASSTSEPTSAFDRRMLPSQYASHPIVMTIAMRIAMFRPTGFEARITHSPPVMQ